MWQNTLRHLLPPTEGQRHRSSIKTGADDVEEGDIWNNDKKQITIILHESSCVQQILMAVVRTISLSVTGDFPLPEKQEPPQ